MTWVALIGAFLQLAIMVLQNKFEKDKAEQARKDALHAQASDAIKSGDISAVNSIFDKLRS